MERTSKRRTLRSSVRGIYADFGFTIYEVFRCAICGIKEAKAFWEQGFTLAGYSVPISEYCPVSGLVGVCKHCIGRQALAEIFRGRPYGLWGKDAKVVETLWKPPALARPVNREPIFIIERGFCDEKKLGNAVSSVWDQVPARTRTTLRRLLSWKGYKADDLPPPWEKKEHGDFEQGALRVEALPCWPEHSNELGMCMHRGHAIRLKASLVTAMPDRVLETLFAHELAHSVQFAVAFSRGPLDFSEEGAIRIMASWGYRDKDIDRWSNRNWEERFEASLARAARRRKRL